MALPQLPCNMDCIKTMPPCRPGWWFWTALCKKYSLCLWWGEYEGPRCCFQWGKVPGFKLVHPKSWSPCWALHLPAHKATLCSSSCSHSGCADKLVSEKKLCETPLKTVAVSHKMQLFHPLSLHIYHFTESFRKTSHQACMSLLCKNLQHTSLLPL